MLAQLILDQRFRSLWEDILLAPTVRHQIVGLALATGEPSLEVVSGLRFDMLDLGTCLIVGLRRLMFISVTALLTSKMYSWDSP